MILIRIPLFEWGVNSYLIGDETTHKALVIDPGGEPERILNEAQEASLEIVQIVNTHGHGDHIGANAAMMQATGAPLAIGEWDKDYLGDPVLNLSTMMAEKPFVSPEANRYLKDGDEILVGETRLKVLSTPGHTSGGICLLAADCIFTGDTLFAGSVGRTDFPRGSQEQLMKSIREKLIPLSDDLKVYPGHGASSSIGLEKQTNPYLTGDFS